MQSCTQVVATSGSPFTGKLTGPTHVTQAMTRDITTHPSGVPCQKASGTPSLVIKAAQKDNVLTMDKSACTFLIHLKSAATKIQDSHRSITLISHMIYLLQSAQHKHMLSPQQKTPSPMPLVFFHPPLQTNLHKHKASLPPWQLAMCRVT